MRGIPLSATFGLGWQCLLFLTVRCLSNSQRCNLFSMIENLQIIMQTMDITPPLPSAKRRNVKPVVKKIIVKIIALLWVLGKIRRSIWFMNVRCASHSEEVSHLPTCSEIWDLRSGKPRRVRFNDNWNCNSMTAVAILFDCHWWLGLALFLSRLRCKVKYATHTPWYQTFRNSPHRTFTTQDSLICNILCHPRRNDKYKVQVSYSIATLPRLVTDEAERWPVAPTLSYSVLHCFRLSYIVLDCLTLF